MDIETPLLLKTREPSRLIRPAGLLWPFELYFESLHSNLEAIHGLDGGLSAVGIIKADKSCQIEMQFSTIYSTGAYIRVVHKSKNVC